MGLLENTGFVFLVSLAAVFAFPQFTEISQRFLLPSLIVAMALSLKDCKFDASLLRGEAQGISVMVVSNYAVLTAIYLVLGAAFLRGELFYGIALIAAAPPAVATVTRAFLFGGDVRLSFMSAAAAYALSLALMPAIASAFIGSAIDPLQILWYAFLFVTIPFAASRLLAFDKKPRRGLVNLAFALAIYATTSPNRGVFFSNPPLIAMLVGISAVRMALPFAAAHLYAKSKGWSDAKRISLYWFASIKNNGFAAFLALSLLSPLAALPAAIDAFVDVAFTIAYDFWTRARK